MGVRRITILTAMAAVAMLAAAPVAQAASGPPRLQRLAVAQTQSLFRFYTGHPQIASPKTCQQAQGDDQEHGVLLLPTLSFGSGNAQFACHTDSRHVLVDLSGFTVTEDKRRDTYTLADGTILLFTAANLPRICDDAIRLVTKASAVLDGHPISGTAVSTGNFVSHINRTANNTDFPFYQDSVDVGHPGRLTTCYVGYKALLHLTQGRHLLRVDLSGSVLTYRLNVEDD